MHEDVPYETVEILRMLYVQGHSPYVLLRYLAERMDGREAYNHMQEAFDEFYLGRVVTSWSMGHETEGLAEHARMMIESRRAMWDRSGAAGPLADLGTPVENPDA